MQQLSLLDDAPAPTGLRMPSGTIVRAAELEDNYRWTATRAWGTGPCILWTLLNPSLANGDRDDPTMLRMIGFSFRWGFGSMIVTNIYPFISPNTDALRVWRSSWTGDDWSRVHDKSALQAWLKNMDVVREQIKKTQTHVAAWGNGADPDDVKNFLDEVTWEYDTIGPARRTVTADAGDRIPVEWKCIGTTAGGAPIHPLARGVHRVPDDAQLIPWKTAT